MKKLLLLFVAFLLPLVASADAVKINGIYYNLVTKAKQAEVTKNPSGYSGAITIPESVVYDAVTYSVTSIGYAAFYGCSSLTSVTIPHSVTSIDDYAFKECVSLNSIEVPNRVTSIGQQAFYECYGLKKVIVPDIAAWCRINFEDADSNPLSYAKHLYSDEDTEVTELTIPNSVTSIGYAAFEGCSGLISVTIPNSVTSIGNGAFSSCSGLTSVTIPNSVTIIGNGAFLFCSGLTSLTIPNSVASIGSATFWGCSGLTSVIIGNSVTSIGEYAFHECNGLTTVTIPNSVTKIGDYAFQSCSGLTSVTIPNSVTSIGDAAFYGCSGLTSVTIPNSVTSIGDAAFSSCSGLTSVTFHCPKIGSWFNYKQSLKEVIIGDDVTSIGNNAFEYCGGLTSVTIPNSVTSIGERAFYGCSGLMTISIGEGVENIGSSAFSKCVELTDVYCYTEKIPTTSSDVFDGSMIDYATLHVPAASVSLYSAAEPWSGFKEIVGICATPIISYLGGKLHFECETEGVTFHYTITPPGASENTGNDIAVTSTYTVKVYASKDGYEDSDIATEEINIRGLKGDVNEDGQVTITDAVGVVDIILNSGK